MMFGRTHIISLFVIVFSGGCVTVGCNSVKDPVTTESRLICEWSVQNFAGGISIVEGNPADKSTEDLMGTGVVFEKGQKKMMRCKYAPVNSGPYQLLAPPGAAPPSSPRAPAKGTWVSR